MIIKQEKQYLESTAQAMLCLAEKLNSVGQPLSQHEEQLIRLACVPALEEMLSITLLDFIKGERSDVLINRLNEFLTNGSLKE